MSIKLKYEWKKIKLWKKGGIIGGILGAIILYYFGKIGEFPPNELSSLKVIIMSITISPLLFPLGIFENTVLFRIGNIYIRNIIRFILGILPYLVIGSSFGQLYQSKKSNNFKTISFFISLLVILGYTFLAASFTLVILLGGD